MSSRVARMQRILLEFSWAMFRWVMYKPPQPKPFGPVVNRVPDVLAHSNRFAFKGVSRLAGDAGVSPSSVSRFLRGQLNPSFVFVARLTAAVEQELGFRIDPRDLVSENGNFLSEFVCDLVQCPGCLPECARAADGRLMPNFVGVLPGAWVASRYPKGYDSRKEEL